MPMEISAEIGDHGDGRFTEIGIVKTQSATFSALGASCNGDKLVCYLETHGADSHVGAKGKVTDFNGNEIGTYIVTGRWKAKSWQSSHRISALVKLFATMEQYVGRGFGRGMVFYGQRLKTGPGLGSKENLNMAREKKPRFIEHT